MVLDTPSSMAAFNKLPIELNKAIAHHLATDKDIANFGAICRATNHAVDGDYFSFWRAKFRERYALKASTSNKELRSKYKRRAKYLRRGTGLQFTRGHTNIEKRVTTVLRDLIVETFQGTTHLDVHHRPQCPNQIVLSRFVMNSFILLEDKRLPTPNADEPNSVNQSLAAVKLMCAHFLFDFQGTKHNVFATEDSQQAVYAATNTAPIYIGEKRNEVNMDWSLHCLNFFRYHMTNPDASQLHDAMQTLDVSEKPSAWREPLKSGSYPLSKSWKGTYAYLDHADLTRIRDYSAGRKVPRSSDEMIFSDLNVDEGNIQTLQLDFKKDNSTPWPNVAEERLQSNREMLFTTSTRAQQSKKANNDQDEERSKNIQFTGWGEDLNDHFYATGWLNPLPDQCGIPGWQRITFMKHFQASLDLSDHDNHWAYEGVVLPGGRIILGRWWYASEAVDFNNDYSGPFILWAVDSDPELVDDDDIDNDAPDHSQA